jgi:anti-sigma factor RsiW
MPQLPGDWRVTDVQLFPTDKAPALLMAVRTDEGRRMTIFAVREKSSAPERPDAVREGAQSVAYWRRGDMSYALTGDQEPGMMDETAEALART